MTTNTMTPTQKIKWAILLKLVDQCKEGRWDCDAINSSGELLDTDITYENVDNLFEDYQDYLYDITSEFREGQEETDLPCEYSIHYESQSVGAEMPDGSWVGWTYWYGGGKHADPDSIEWMSKAYAVTFKEEVVTIKRFSVSEV